MQIVWNNLYRSTAGRCFLKGELDQRAASIHLATYSPDESGGGAWPGHHHGTRSAGEREPCSKMAATGCSLWELHHFHKFYTLIEYLYTTRMFMWLLFDRVWLAASNIVKWSGREGKKGADVQCYNATVKKAIRTQCKLLVECAREQQLGIKFKFVKKISRIISFFIY